MGHSKLTSETHPSGHMTVICLKPFDLQSWASPLQSKTSCLLEVSSEESERERMANKDILGGVIQRLLEGFIL